MNFSYAKGFEKRLQRLDHKIQIRFLERLKMLLETPRDPQLRDHPLKGDLIGKRAFSVTGDYRVIYRLVAEDHLKLIDIGRHSQVY